MNDLTVNDILNEREVGSVIPLLVELEGEEVPIFFVKDYHDVLEKIEETDMMALKNSILGTDECILFLIMFKFAESYDTTYDLWFNYGELWHNEFLHKLKDSSRIIIDFRDEDNERIKSIEIENTLGETCEEYIAKCSETVVQKGKTEDNIITLESKKRFELWNIDIANDFLDNMFEVYESIEELWNEL